MKGIIYAAMALLQKNIGLYTDHYELTMAQAYFMNGNHNKTACFDYFFRKAPFKGSYAVFAGLYELLETIQELRFSEEDVKYLKSLGFKTEFTDYLKKFSFSGNIYSVAEGELVFPNEPLLRVEGTLLEAQLLETLLLNILNFESLIATKASRMRQAAGDKVLIDFGLRRAQGLGGIQASKAAILGGVDRTSNEYSAFLFGLKSSGTQAHSFIQSYDRQIDAFREFASVYPQDCVLLVDTYDTLKSGVPDAIQVGKELEQRGYKLYGIRIDSGDLEFISKEARKMLDEAGLHYVKIVASNQLDELAIEVLLGKNVPVDAFGIGTSLITGQADAALDGVYKLTMSDYQPRLKISEEPDKIISPGIKKILRYIDADGQFYCDGILLKQENFTDEVFIKYKRGIRVKNYTYESIINKVMEKGRIIIPSKSPQEINLFVRQRLSQLDNKYKVFNEPAVYLVGSSKELLELRTSLIRKMS